MSSTDENVHPVNTSGEGNLRMNGKKFHAGGEIDGYCTKCRLDLAHRIIAMVGDQPKRVECSTCGSHHNYYRPKNAPATAKASRKSAPPSARASGPPGAKPKGTTSARAIAAAEAENQRERTWEKAVSGKPVNAFKPYGISSTFEQQDLIHHSKFGDGYVVRVIDKNKIEVMFRESVRTLAHGVEG